MLAASLLRLAECLLARSDSAIVNPCIRLLGEAESLGHEGDLSAEGRLSIVWNQIRHEWEHHIEGVSYDVQAAMTLRLAQWFDDDNSSGKYEHLKGGLREEEYGRLVELESVFSKLVTSTRNRAPRRSQIEEVQKLSLENWSFHRIQTLSEREGELAEALGRARRRLDRARDVLDQAEDMLTDARRNVKWWACLYQLRAQLHVELFLLQVTEIWPSEEWKGEKRRFIARTVNQLESGSGYPSGVGCGASPEEGA